MRKTLLLMSLLLTGMLAMAQVSVPGTNVTFEFPDGGWKYLPTTNVDDNTTVFLFN